MPMPYTRDRYIKYLNLGADAVVAHHPHVPENYELLIPLVAKSFIEEEKRRMIFLEPNRFKNATEEEWSSYLLSEEPEGFVKDSYMDFFCVMDEAVREENKAWEKSKLEKVKTYILNLI